MNLDLAGRHALVCGASEGIGRAAARELALLGADVTVLARRAAVLEELVAALPCRAGQRHDALAADVGDTDALSAAVRQLADAAPVQVLVNNTGGPPGGPVHAADSDAFLDAFRKHLLANQALVQAVLPGMRAAGYGRVINVISTSVKEPIAGLGVSNTIRGAVASWAKTLAGELAADGITVNNVLPGFTRTGRLASLIAARATDGRSEDAVAAGMLATVPAARFAEPEEVAAAIAFLASPAAAYINGINLPVDGGRTRSL
jgi:3-oxoacyl-[acyl-carrier protein] reductase